MNILNIMKLVILKRIGFVLVCIAELVLFSLAFTLLSKISCLYNMGVILYIGYIVLVCTSIIGMCVIFFFTLPKEF